MAIQNVACPNCGHEAMITVNAADDKIKKISSGSNLSGVKRSNYYQSACKNCDEPFYYWLE